MLHTVNKSPFRSTSLQTCTGYAQSGDAILLIEDGVYAAIKGTDVEFMFSGLDNVNVYALAPDVQARGLAEDKLIESVELVGYDKFVELAAANDKVQSWL